MVIKLKKPITFGEGDQAKKIEEVDLKLDDLTGADVIFCTREAEAGKGGEPVITPMLDQELHMHLAAKASGVPVGALKKLGAFDFVQVVTVVQGFLTGSG